MSYEDWYLTVNGVRSSFGAAEVVSWNIEGREYRTDDTDRPRDDGRWFGQDYVTPGDITIELIIRADGKTRQERFDNAMAERARFTRLWNADGIRRAPGITTRLTVANRFSVDGRPRHVDWDDSRATFGIIRGTALFVRQDHLTRSADTINQRAVTVQLIPPAVGGIKAPLVAPITTTRGSDRGKTFTVGGTHPVWPKITIKGPIAAGAQVELLGIWTIVLNRALNYDHTAVINPDPSDRYMTLNGRPVNLLAPQSARLSQIKIPQGTREITLRGTSLEGTASVTAVWAEYSEDI